MIIDQTFTVNASHAKTAEFFFDIEQVSSCMPGVDEVREVSPGRYEATLGVRLGPIRAAFKGAITLDDGEAPNRLLARGEGRDQATGSMAKVDFTADLSEDQPGVTTVRAVADVAIRGRLSQFGTGVMRAAAGEIVQEFAGCVNARLAASSPPVEAQWSGQDAKDEQPNTVRQFHASPSVPRQRGLVSILVRGLLRSLAGALRRTADRIELRIDRSGARS